MISRLINALCIGIAVLSLIVTYSNWSIGAGLERDLLTCLDHG